MRIAITSDTRMLRCRLLIKLIELCGGTPVLVPYMIKTSKGVNAANLSALREKHLAHVQEILKTCEGLLLPGNRYDIPPSAYAETFIHPQTAKRLPDNPFYFRLETETLMAKHALDAKWPILGICGGMQLMNVILGGNLVQHLPEDKRTRAHKVKHYDPSLKHLSREKQKKWESTFPSHIQTGSPQNIYPRTHPMEVEESSLLGKIYRQVNPEMSLSDVYELSIHHQGCFPENLSKRLKPVAIAPDGLVEAAVLTNYPAQCLLTQFHLECNVSGIAKACVELLIKKN